MRESPTFDSVLDSSSRLRASSLRRSREETHASRVTPRPERTFRSAATRGRSDRPHHAFSSAMCAVCNASFRDVNTPTWKRRPPFGAGIRDIAPAGGTKICVFVLKQTNKKTQKENIFMYKVCVICKDMMMGEGTGGRKKKRTGFRVVNTHIRTQFTQT